MSSLEPLQSLSWKALSLITAYTSNLRSSLSDWRVVVPVVRLVAIAFFSFCVFPYACKPLLATACIIPLFRAVQLTVQPFSLGRFLKPLKAWSAEINEKYPYIPFIVITAVCAKIIPSSFNLSATLLTGIYLSLLVDTADKKLAGQSEGEFRIQFAGK